MEVWPVLAIPAERRRLLWMLTVAHLLVDVGQGAVPALGPYLRQQLGLSYAQVGAVTLTATAFGASLQPLLGVYSDRARSGRVMVAGLLLVGAGLMGLGLASSLPGVLASAALVGMGVAAFHPEATRAAFDLGGEARVTAMSWFQVGGNAGYGLGPALTGAAVLALGPRGLWVLALLPAAWAAVVYARLPQLHRAGAFGPPRTRPAGAGARPAPAGSGAAAALPQDRWTELLKVLGVVVLRLFFQVSLVAFVPLYYVEVLGGNPRWASLLVSLYLLSGAAGTLLGSPMADRWGLRRCLAGAMALLVPLHLLTLWLPGSWAVLTLALQGFALVSTYAVTAVLSQLYLPSRPALAAGLNLGLGMAGGAVGTGLTGLMADAWGLETALYTLTAVPALAAALALSLREGEEAVPANKPVNPGTLAERR